MAGMQVYALKLCDLHTLDGGQAFDKYILPFQMFREYLAVEGNLLRLSLGGFAGSWIFIFTLTVRICSSSREFFLLKE